MRFRSEFDEMCFYGCESVVGVKSSAFVYVFFFWVVFIGWCVLGVVFRENFVG